MLVKAKPREEKTVKMSDEELMAIILDELSRHTRPPIQRKDRLAKKITVRIRAEEEAKSAKEAAVISKE